MTDEELQEMIDEADRDGELRFAPLSFMAHFFRDVHLRAQASTARGSGPLRVCGQHALCTKKAVRSYFPASPRLTLRFSPSLVQATVRSTRRSSSGS